MPADGQRRYTRSLVVGVFALILLGAFVFITMFSLAKNGVFDSWLVTPTPLVPPTIRMTQSPPATAQPLVTQTPAPTETRQEPTTTELPASTATHTLTPSPAATATPKNTPTPTETLNPLSGKYQVEYIGCIKHGSSQGTVKGQVFDQYGQVIAGAQVFIALNDWEWDQPAISNGAGWYEFYVDNDLKIRIVRMVIDGQEVPLVGHEDQEFKSQGGCFEHVNLRQQP